MRILVFSDTHGNINRCIDVLENIPADLILHLGDTVRDAQDLKWLYKKIPLEFVAGNNDFSGEVYKIIEAEEVRLFITHGHTYGVHGSKERLAAAAKANGCQYALHGHTHQAKDEVTDGVRVICPGSPSYPRGGNPSCLIMEIEKGHVGTLLYEL